MSDLAPKQAENRLLAIAIVVVVTAIFAFTDGVAKFLVGRLPPVEVAWLRFSTSLLVILPIAYHRVGRQAFRTSRPLLQFARGVFFSLCSLCFMIGLTYLSLADATAINFVWPLLITVFSVILLGEKVGIRRWSATAVGFCGMLLIVRPGSSSFQAAAVWPLATAVLWALTNIITRSLAGKDKPETTMVLSTACMLLCATLLLPFYWVTPTLNEVLLAVVIGVVSTLGHALLIFAYERSSASTLAPFAYSQLVWATMIGYVGFGTIPDRWIVAGGALIIASGIYTAHRERVKAVPAKPSSLPER
jgi:drug/metabolite transporter (DMT)-like permease